MLSLQKYLDTSFIHAFFTFILENLEDLLGHKGNR